MANTDNLGPVYTGMSQNELLKLIEAAKASVPPPLTPSQIERTKEIEEELDPGGLMRQRFRRPPRGPVAPRPMPRPEGLWQLLKYKNQRKKQICLTLVI